MRLLPILVSTAITIGLVYALNTKIGPAPPLGKFLSPQHGFWQNAEPANENFSQDLKFPALKGNANVYFDERLIPHVFAENDEDLYFIQGFLHAKFRLWQMDFQTEAAAGNVSAVIGDKAINYDREQRRLGMVYAAEKALKEVENDPESKMAFDAYSNGVNAYISTLTENSIPIEYKLLDYEPNKWTNLKTALLLKMMAKMLSSGTENDIVNTNAKSLFSMDEFKMIYPQVHDSLEPIVPKGTIFDNPGIVPVAPTTADSIYFGNKDVVKYQEVSKPDINNGSNNWVVAGSKTQSGVPILCNDPHLELSFPSIWYEMQLQTPSSNVYGVSLPGTPYIIIGFNDSIAWGVTNAQRDVKDYYEIKFKDATRKEYWFNNQWITADQRVETIKVKGGAEYLDTVAYTVFGPVMFDETFSNEISNKKSLAVRWTAHDPSNEGKTLYMLNRAKNYDEYAEAIKFFKCPGQNFVFASKAGDIAIWQQGKFPARWNGQGLFVMPGQDSSFMWQGFIPQAENPHSKNPVQGFLQSANQRPADSTYPYFIPGSYLTPRGITITNRLAAMTGIIPDDMKKLQYDYFNTFAEDARTILLSYVRENELDANAKKYVEMLRNWDLYAGPNSTGQTVFQTWWDSLEVEIWKDDITRVTPSANWPEEETLMELLKKDSAMLFIDNINTPLKETLFDAVTKAIKKASFDLETEERAGRLSWTKHKDPTIYHLLKTAVMPFARTGIPVGGNGNIVNAVTKSHGPSWRMIVQLTKETESYVVYPGGQSGNPGSKFYDNFVDTWAKGEYYKAWMMKKGEEKNEKVKWTLRFKKG
ncbi:MAG: penicillin acylase family protein [Chitinophagaceae bacterium]|nr:penicillin acylase family protein [Chitinophagaceae bacterium]